MSTKAAAFLCIVSACAWEVHGQGRDSTVNNPNDKDLIDGVTKILHIKAKETKRKRGVGYFSIVPSTVSQSGNKLLVSSINAAFYAGNPDSTYLSSIYFVPYTNLAQQYGFMSTQNIWTANNKWNIPGEFKIQKLSPYSYGLGSRTTNRDRFTIDYNYLRLYLTGNTSISQFVFAGLGLNYDRQYSVRVPGATDSTNAYRRYGIGTGSSSASTGITFNVLFDNRKNSINPDGGFYSTLVYRVNPQSLSNQYAWNSIYLDARKYIQLRTARRNIFALWGFYWGAYGNVPYLNLPGTSMEYNARSGRGYALGRFRGKQMLYLEGEYRFTLSQNGFWGGVLFANLQSLSEPVSNQFQMVNPAAGFGTRMKFNKKSNINLDIDFGFGKDSFNFYVNLGEIF